MNDAATDTSLCGYVWPDGTACARWSYHLGDHCAAADLAQIALAPLARILSIPVGEGVRARLRELDGPTQETP